jgi:hypothetical protein
MRRMACYLVQAYSVLYMGVLEGDPRQQQIRTIRHPKPRLIAAWQQNPGQVSRGNFMLTWNGDLAWPSPV